MKKIKINKINETIFYEKLGNGLDIYLYNNNNYTNNYVTFTTKFGSIYNEFIPLNTDKSIKVPNGIAHFLEHKVFAQENDPQPDEFFGKSGTSSNAYTTFKNTTYLFSGPNNLEENILYLLDYVQSPYFTDENVNKEKGIITQEIHMCNDRPVDILYEHIRSSCLKNNTFKNSIIGTVEDINSIDKELLDTCYRRFYHPSNMFLVVTGNFDPVEIISKIKENQSKKTFVPNLEFKRVIKKEDNEIVKEKDYLKINTNIPKVAYNLKINYNELDLEKRKVNLYLYILFSILFDETSSFDEKMKEKEIITGSMGVNILNVDTHIVLSLINETDKYESLINEIKNTLNNINICKADLDRKKKVIISNEIFSYEKIEFVNEMIIDNIIFDNHIENNIIDLINSLNLEQMNDIINKISFDNYSVVVVGKDINQQDEGKSNMNLKKTSKNKKRKAYKKREK